MFDIYPVSLQAQRHEIALAITRNLRTMTKKDIHAEVWSFLKIKTDTIYYEQG